MPKLGVNIDHVATVREARKTFEPDSVEAALESIRAGCDSIVCHLRKDRRHISDNDLKRLKDAVPTKLNLEMSIDPEIVDIACKVKPKQATIVPENREEITTEGGLDVKGNSKKIKEVVKKLQASGIQVSFFIDPLEEQVEASRKMGVDIVEFHTGQYAEEFHSGGDFERELENLREVSQVAFSEGLVVCAGHGLTYRNVKPVASIENMYELNIGHSIISKSIFTGIFEAVKQMKELSR